MLTLFTAPKSFKGHYEIIQINAIQSWLHLRPECEIILLGNDEGTAEVASRFGVLHLPDIESNEYGTPLINSMFSKAQGVARYQLLCYINRQLYIAEKNKIPIENLQLLLKQKNEIIKNLVIIEISKPVILREVKYEVSDLW